VRAAYIAGPFAARTAAEIEVNVARANALAFFAVRCGYAPLVVHPAVLAGAYGDDGVADERRAGLAATAALARLVGAGGGLLWVLHRDDGTPSAGTVGEVSAFTDGFVTCMYRTPRVGPARLERDIATGTWSEWQDWMAHQGHTVAWRFPALRTGNGEPAACGHGHVGQCPLCGPPGTAC
jgi:hypothetical protein